MCKKKVIKKVSGKRVFKIVDVSITKQTLSASPGHTIYKIPWMEQSLWRGHTTQLYFLLLTVASNPFQHANIPQCTVPIKSILAMVAFTYV